MVLSFFDYKGFILQHFAPLDTTIKGDFVVEAINKFLTVKVRERPDVRDARRLQCDNAPVHTSVFSRPT